MLPDQFVSHGRADGDGHIGPLPPHLIGLNRENDLASAIVAADREPLIVLDASLRIVAASKSFYDLFQMDPEDAQGRFFCDLSPDCWNAAALPQLLQDALSSNQPFEGHEVDLDLPNAERRHMLLDARPISQHRDAGAALLIRLQDVTKLRAADGEKEAQLRRQEMLLVEVHHRVANSLQIIASILLLKARSVQSAETRFHLHDVHQRVISIATVQSQLSATGSIDEVEVGPYLSLLCESLGQSMIADDHAVTISSKWTAGAVSPGDAISFGLIVTELVINALKHGFPHGGEGHISVDYSTNGDAWDLTVSDDGVGRGAKTAEPRHVGLGTSIVEALARQLKATVKILALSPGSATLVSHAA